MIRFLKIKKREKLRNKRLIKKYPWCRPWGRKDYLYTMLFDDMPGWWKAFGKQFCSDIQARYPQNPELYISEYKEKWGGLDIYFGGVNDSEIHEIANDYRIISENVCYICGKPDVPLTNFGWILPLCEDCFKKRYPHLDYKKAICSESRMNSVETTNNKRYEQRERLAERIRRHEV